MPKPKILCLHGGGSNSDITVFQTMGLSLTKHMECMYVDAPHIVNYCYPGLNRLSDGPFRVWAMPHGASESDQQSQWDQSLQFLADYCNEHGPFEGVYAFSQGTAMITSMSHPSIWKERFNMESCPWKFAICACGGASFQISIPKDISVPLKIPSFHIFGAKVRVMCSMILEIFSQGCMNNSFLTK